MFEKSFVDEFAEDREFCSGWDESLFVLQLEDFIGRTGEDPGEGQRQRQARHITVALDRVDALAGNARGLRELLLRPPQGGSAAL